MNLTDPTAARGLLIKAAKAEGFVLADTLDLEKIETDPDQTYSKHVAAYDQWLREGSQGEMSYLVRGRDRRANPRLVFPETRSVLCVALPYPAQAAGEKDPTRGVRYARYLQGPDYHDEIKAKLERVIAQVQIQIPQLKAKSCVDTSAVLERTLCAIAGLGWIGKNSMLIHPQWGSYLFLGVLFTNLETGRGPQLLPDYCGHCTRCLEGCPTQAIIAPRTIDSRKCISYLTLEKRGPFSVEDSKKTAPWVAGCDICQEVCPFNTKAEKRAIDAPSPAENCTQLNTWEALSAETETDYQARIRNSALSRIKFSDFKRNLEAAVRR